MGLQYSKGMDDEKKLFFVENVTVICLNSIILLTQFFSRIFVYQVYESKLESQI